jgi:transposase
MARKRRKYSVEFKLEAVRLAKEQGMTVTEVSRELGIDHSVIRAWIRKHEEGTLSGARGRPQKDLEEENKRLRRENAVLKEEREILKKAAAFFAKETR